MAKVPLGIISVLSAMTEIASADTTPTPPPSPAYAVCMWDGKMFSYGAQFCVGPGATIQCNGGNWTILKSDALACDQARPIQPGATPGGR